jgi:hypothetical protein
MDPYPHKSSEYRKDKLVAHCRRVAGNGERVWIFRPGGLPHTETQALQIIEMCEILQVPVTDLGSSELFHSMARMMLQIKTGLMRVEAMVDVGLLQTQDPSNGRQTVQPAREANTNLR